MLFRQKFLVFSFVLIITLIGTYKGYCQEGKRWALLVGVDYYSDPTITPLRFCSSDVKEVHKAFLDLGFDKVISMVNNGDSKSNIESATSVSILSLLRSLANDIKPQDTFVFYFSGHGVEVGKNSFLLTVDTKIKDFFEENGIVNAINMNPESEAQKILSSIKANKKLVIIDACRSYPVNTAKGDLQSEFGNQLTDTLANSFFLEPIQSIPNLPPAIATIYACYLGERSYEWVENKHGVFTFYLLEGIRKAIKGEDASSEGKITAASLAIYGQLKVTKWSEEHLPKGQKQTPWIKQEGFGELVLASVKPIPTSNESIDSNPVYVRQPNNVSGVIEELKKLEEDLKNNTRSANAKISVLQESNSIYAPKGEFETSINYLTRMSTYAWPKFYSIHQEYLQDLQHQIAEIYRNVFPVGEIDASLGEYDPDKQQYSIKIKTLINGSDFVGEGIIFVEPKEARSLKENWEKVIKTGYASINPDYQYTLTKVELHNPNNQKTYMVDIQGNNIYHNLGYHNLGQNYIQAVEFSPNGKIMALARHAIYGSGNDRITEYYIDIWDIDSRKLIKNIDRKGGSKSNICTFSPDGNYLVVPDGKSIYSITFYDTKDYVITEEITNVDGKDDAVFTQDGQYLAVAQNKGLVSIFIVKSKEPVINYKLNEISENIAAVSLSPDGKYIAIGTHDILPGTIKKVYIKNLITGEVINELSFNDSVNTLSFSPDGRFLAVGILSGKTVLWDMIGESKVPKEVWRDKMPANIVTFPAAITFSSPTIVSFSPDGDLLAIGVGKKIAIWRINALIDISLEKLIEIPTDYEIKDLAWNSNGNLLSDGQQIFRIIVPKEAIPKDPTGSGIGRPKDPTGSGAGRPKDPTGSGIGRPKKKEPDPKDPTGSGVGRPKE